MKDTKLSFKAYLAITLLALFHSTIYSIPYIKSVFYDGMLEITGVNNAQLGILMTIYGLGEVFTLGIGGIIAEKYDHKKVILFFSTITAGACALLVIKPSYIMTLIVWTILVLSTLFMIWGCLFKAIRVLGPDSMQGKINGLYYGINGIGYFVINMACLYVYDIFAKTSAADGMKAVFACLGVLTMAFGISGYIALKAAGTYEKEIKVEDTEKKSILAEFKIIAKEKGVWYFGGTLFCMYSTNIAIQYFTPYFTNVLGVAVVFGGFLAILRQYGMQAIGSPLGGMLADRIGSIAKVMIGCSALAVMTILSIIILPAGLKTVGIVTLIMMLASLLNTIGSGIQYAMVSESKIPIRNTAAAVGMGSMLGFLPDVYQHVLFGSWIDKYGAVGYTYIFIYGAATSVIAIVLLANFLRYIKGKSSDNFLNAKKEVYASNE